ncbi:hypothetical protein HYC85_031624 [Camellia sinensis]|uniref:Mitoferrin n=1 Tax=Camellia sinensis TaxID=4442 RepID=A0A7J7FRX7_CAMSI|nr:hypothetical protein HYC85_031624 [Camellia sinensis]
MATDATPKFQKPDLLPPDFHPEITSLAGPRRSPLLAVHDSRFDRRFGRAHGHVPGRHREDPYAGPRVLPDQVRGAPPSPRVHPQNRRPLPGSTAGIGAMGLGAGPAHAVYFSVYEFCKKSFSGGNPNNSAAHAAAGVFATVASDAVLTPMDMVKQRLQLSSSPYKGVMDCVRRVAMEEGIGAFYASYRTTVLMNAPFTAVHFATYEAVKRGLMEVSPESVNDERWVVHATCRCGCWGVGGCCDDAA